MRSLGEPTPPPRRDRTDPRIVVASQWPRATVELVRVLSLAAGATVLALAGKVPPEWALIALGAGGIPGFLAILQGRRR